MMEVRVYHNGDDTFIAWKPDGKIDECRGFALFRRRNGVEEVVSTWVGFEGQKHKEGERRASTSWPIQKYQWADYMANPGDKVQYRVVPMVGPDKDNLRADGPNASDWTAEIELSHEVAKNIQTYFNRGIVAAQWVSRRLEVTPTNLQAGKLDQVVSTPGDPMREYLFGPLGKRLFELLASAAKEKRDIYAALYELNDEQLESALEKCGKRAHLVLGNGSVKKKGDDQNEAARDRLRPRVDLHDRLTSPRALAHNKFLVICDEDGKPRWVWTGSQNWTKTGLCTQANNSILIDNQTLAREYKKQWESLRDVGDETPRALKESNSELREFAARLHLWFTPTIGEVDLEEARRVLRRSPKPRAVLFLMFNPGPKDTLLNEILALAGGTAGGNLYIRGVLNQDPSTVANPVDLFDSDKSRQSDTRILLPAAIDEPTAWFVNEIKKKPGTFAMVHSKVIVVDPFGEDPVVMTGSHNLGPKASKTNDENLLIIRGLPGVAAAYATNIMSIYNQYRWRYQRQVGPKSRRWDGLKDSDSWQDWHWISKSPQLREMNFWVGR
jgi:phosphatidylserine/phosphatidylglycerophosphate/cardiolipin synthase-like enzyme